MVTGSNPRAPIHRMAWSAIAMAVVAGVLALYGSLYAEKQIPGTPLCEARGEPPVAPADFKPLGAYTDHQIAQRNPKGPIRGLYRVRYGAEWTYYYAVGALDRAVVARTKKSKFASYTLQLVVYVLPFGLGLAGALTGGWAMKVVQQSGGKYGGDTLAVFSMMVGGLAAVVAGCMMLSLYVWPLLPTFYTT